MFRKGSWLLTCFINPFRLVTHASLFQSASVISRQPQLYWKPHFQYYQRNSWGWNRIKIDGVPAGLSRKHGDIKVQSLAKKDLPHPTNYFPCEKLRVQAQFVAKYGSPRHKAARCAPKPMTIKQRDFHGFWISSTSCPETLLSWRSWRFGG